jgi:hypothetical protein
LSPISKPGLGILGKSDSFAVIAAGWYRRPNARNHEELKLAVDSRSVQSTTVTFMPPSRPGNTQKPGPLPRSSQSDLPMSNGRTAIALGELRKGKDRRVTQLIATLSARYHSACSEQAAVPRGEAA